MQPFHKNSVIVMGIIAASAALSACGGGSSSSTTTTPLPTGKAIDYYLSGSTENFLDCGQTATTDGNGNFTFPSPFCGLTQNIEVTGGKDIGTGLPFHGVLKTIAQPNKTGIILSEFTTLIASGVNATQLATLFGLSGQDLLTLDPMTNATALKANIILQQVLDQVSSALVTNAAANGITLTAAQAENAALTALVAQMNTGSVTSLASLTSSANIAAILQNSALNAGFSSTASSTIVTNNSATITNTLATVTSALASLTIGANPQATIASIGGTNLATLINIVKATDNALNTAPTAALNNYLQLNAIMLNNSGTATPITGAGNIALTTASGTGLTDVQVAMATVGTPFANGTSRVNAGLTYSIGNNTVNLIINNIDLTFNSTTHALTGATVPAGSSYSFKLSGAVTATGSATNLTADTLFKNGNLDLSITSFLSKLAGASGQPVVAFTPKAGDNVIVSLAMAPAGGNTSLTVGTGSGTSAVTAPNVTVTTAAATLAGQGVNATVKVQ
jgi:hypothetical protein